MENDDFSGMVMACAALRKENDRLRAERDLWHARAVAMFWRLPDDTLCGDLRRDAEIALGALKTSKPT